MKGKQAASFNPETFLLQIGIGKTTLTCPKKEILFSQGDAADAVFDIQKGKAILSVVSPQGKEAIVAMLEQGAYDYLAPQIFRVSPAARSLGSTLADLAFAGRSARVHSGVGNPSNSGFY